MISTTTSRPTFTDAQGNAEWQLSGTTMNGAISALRNNGQPYVRVMLLREDLTVDVFQYTSAEARDLVALLAHFPNADSEPFRTALRAAANHIDRCAGAYAAPQSPPL